MEHFCKNDHLSPWVLAKIFWEKWQVPNVRKASKWFLRPFYVCFRSKNIQSTVVKFTRPEPQGEFNLTLQHEAPKNIFWAFTLFIWKIKYFYKYVSLWGDLQVLQVFYDFTWLMWYVCLLIWWYMLLCICEICICVGMPYDGECLLLSVKAFAGCIQDQQVW